jgi:hypothetical protein
MRSQKQIESTLVLLVKIADYMENAEWEIFGHSDGGNFKMPELYNEVITAIGGDEIYKKVWKTLKGKA